MQLAQRDTNNKYILSHQQTSLRESHNKDSQASQMIVVPSNREPALRCPRCWRRIAGIVYWDLKKPTEFTHSARPSSSRSMLDEGTSPSSANNIHGSTGQSRMGGRRDLGAYMRQEWLRDTRGDWEIGFHG